MKGISNLVELLYPVGSIYLSTNAADPALLFGGVWSRIQDRFLLAAGDTYAAGVTGGEAAHQLTVDELAVHDHAALSSSSGNHTHQIGCDLDAAQGAYCSSVHGASTGAESFKGATSSAGEHTHTITVYSTGSNVAHNNMPPYIAVYMWERIE